MSTLIGVHRQAVQRAGDVEQVFHLDHSAVVLATAAGARSDQRGSLRTHGRPAGDDDRRPALPRRTVLRRHRHASQTGSGTRVTVTRVRPEVGFVSPSRQLNSSSPSRESDRKWDSCHRHASQTGSGTRVTVSRVRPEVELMSPSRESDRKWDSSHRHASQTGSGTRAVVVFVARSATWRTLAVHVRQHLDATVAQFSTELTVGLTFGDP